MFAINLVQHSNLLTKAELRVTFVDKINKIGFTTEIIYCMERTFLENICLFWPWCGEVFLDLFNIRKKKKQAKHFRNTGKSIISYVQFDQKSQAWIGEEVDG